MKSKLINKKALLMYIPLFFACFLYLFLSVMGFVANKSANICESKVNNAWINCLDNKIIKEKSYQAYNTSVNLGQILPNITLHYGKKSIEVKNQNIDKLSNVRKEIVSGGMKSRVGAMNFAFYNGFTKEQAIYYAFPELETIISFIEKELFVPSEDAKLNSIKNTGNIYITEAKKGVKMNKNKLFNDIFYIFNNFFDNYDIWVEKQDIIYNIDSNAFKNNNILRGSFKTYYGSSSSSRKNNIRRALACFDGIVLNPGETLSFNSTTGARGEDNGYEKAKIIKNGTFVEEFGGGVCQVSTTIYNSALLADLEIIEVHPHSLPVSYIEPCFDAMVNSGSSDLVIKNNQAYPIIFATCDKNNYCLVNIYGPRNNYQIVRKSEKTEDLLQFTKETTNNFSAYGFSKPLMKGESKTISYGKPGYKATGTLEYYKEGVLVKTKKIRANTYNPTKEVVLVG